MQLIFYTLLNVRFWYNYFDKYIKKTFYPIFELTN